MSNRHEWKLDGSDNDAIRVWMADVGNIHNCEVCPYGYDLDKPSGLPCGLQVCHVIVYNEVAD